MYLLSQILVFLLLAGFLGLVIGWFMRGYLQEQRFGAGTDEIETASATLQSLNAAATAEQERVIFTPPQGPSTEAQFVPADTVVTPAVKPAQPAPAPASPNELEATIITPSQPTIIVVKRRGKKSGKVQVVTASLQQLREENARLRVALADGDGAEAATARYLAALDRENRRLRARLSSETSSVTQDAVEQLPPTGLGLPYPSRMVTMSAQELEATLLAGAPGAVPSPMPRPKGKGDDLKAIKGVGPALERWLHQQGIFTFRQIACMSPSELYWMVENLPQFGARVYRENWVAQADQLMRAGS
jgi:predicted flap endonuclease-1-like 5' DNA nuclease